MKKGLNAWTYPNHIPMERRIELTSEAGFDGFEPLYEVEGYVSMASSDADLKKVREKAESLGLVIPSIVGAHYENYSICSSDKANAAEGVERVKRMIHAASVLGADTILLVAGSVSDKEGFSYEQVYETAIENVRKLAKTAEEENVKIGVEPIWSKFLLSPLEMKTFVDYAGSDHVGVYFDVGNVMIWGFPEQWIRILGKRIFKCHFKDFKRGVGNMHGFVDLLAGDVNFPEVMKAFREVGYDDFCTCEVSPYQYDDTFMAHQTARAMDRIFSY